MEAIRLAPQDITHFIDDYISATQGEILRLVTTARAASENGQFDVVITEAQKIMGVATTDQVKAIAYYWLAVGYAGQGNIAEAKKYEAQALQLAPEYTEPFVDEFIRSNSFWAIIDQAQAAWREDRNAEIVTFAEQALAAAQQDDERASAYYWLGIGEYRRDNLAVAEKHELKAIELSPNGVGPYVTMGAIKLGLGDVGSARVYAEKAVAIEPEYEWANNIMGHVLLAEQRPKDAIPFFQKAIEAAPNAQFKSSLEHAQRLAETQ